MTLDFIATNSPLSLGYYAGGCELASFTITFYAQ